MREITTDPQAVRAFLEQHDLKTNRSLIDFCDGSIDALDSQPRKAKQSPYYDKGYDFQSEKQC